MDSKTKKCNKCGSTLNLSEFYKQSGMKDGLFGKCKTCTKRDVKENRESKADHYRAFERARAMLPHRVEMRAKYQASEAGKKVINRVAAAWRKRNPIKRKAQYTAGNALRAGLIVRKPCEVCGKEKAHAHHDDYSRPLDVRWLCTTHHAEWHRHNTPNCPDQEILI